MKYRIIKEGKWYIPQHRVLFLWFAFADHSVPPDYSQHMQFEDLEAAEKWLTDKCAEKNQRIVVIKGYTVEKMKHQIEINKVMDS